LTSVITWNRKKRRKKC